MKRQYLSVMIVLLGSLLGCLNQVQDHDYDSSKKAPKPNKIKYYGFHHPIPVYQYGFDDTKLYARELDYSKLNDPKLIVYWKAYLNKNKKIYKVETIALEGNEDRVPGVFSYFDSRGRMIKEMRKDKRTCRIDYNDELEETVEICHFKNGNSRKTISKYTNGILKRIDEYDSNGKLKFYLKYDVDNNKYSKYDKNGNLVFLKNLLPGYKARKLKSP